MLAYSCVDPLIAISHRTYGTARSVDAWLTLLFTQPKSCLTKELRTKKTSAKLDAGATDVSCEIAIVRYVDDRSSIFEESVFELLYAWEV
jgi:hypothetical protein